MVTITGLHGVPTISKVFDLLATAAGLVMWQRGVNMPLACIHGLEYEKVRLLVLSIPWIRINPIFPTRKLRLPIFKARIGEIKSENYLLWCN